MIPQDCSQAARIDRTSHSFPALPGASTQGNSAGSGRQQVFRRLVALGMAALLLPLTQVEVLAQQAWPPSGGYQQNPYPPGQPYSGQYQQPQYQQPQYALSPNPQNQPYNGQYAGQYAPDQQGYAQQPGYGQQPPDAGQPYADAGPGGNEPPSYRPSQPVAQAFTAAQLEEMLAPIALYPDALLAQVLAAATYPDQVSVADQWLRAQGYASTDQIAASAEGQNWDPSVKALTAFPQVLAQMNHNLAWTTDVGNAYYNQPRDVMQTVQVLRQRAQAAGTLQNTPQEAMNYDQGNIELAPPNPQEVYVPSYNPWNAYGQPISPYPGFSLLGALQSFAGSGVLRFGLGIAMNAFSHTGFGWLSWALDWLGGGILFNHSSYASQSASVAHWGSSRGSNGGRNWASNGRPGYGRSGYAGSGSGYERGQMSPSRDAYGRQGPPTNGYNRGYGNNGAYQDNRAYARPQEGYAAQRPIMGGEYAAGSNRGYPARPENNVRPAFQDYSYGRSQERMPAAVAPRQQQAYARPGYGSSYYGGSAQTYNYGRSGYGYGSPQQAWRSPSTSMQRGAYDQRAYAAPSSRGFMQSAPKQERSGGFHLFGGGSEHYGGGKPPKSFGGGGKHSGGGGGHSSSHSGGGHHH